MRRLPEITLDDRAFQDLVNEARLRIGKACPEWTEHNVSDPGITLIEQFAWMTEMLLYRVNRIPEKLHVELLELLGIRLEEPTEARTDVRFRLAAPPVEPVLIAGGSTEVGTVRTANEESVIFTTSEDFTIPAARPMAYLIERSGQVKDVGVGAGVARPRGADQLAFGSPPQVNDALYVGFDAPLSRLMLQLDVDCSQARGAGVDPEDPPLRWEVSTARGWRPATVLEDRTGGFNYGSGIVLIDVPPGCDATAVGGKRAYWLRCRLDATSRISGAVASYSHPPEIYAIAAAPIGATIPTWNCARVTDEVLGESDGTPGQAFRLRYAPMLVTERGETLEISNPETGVFERWDERDSFAESGGGDRHFTLDLPTGLVMLGPAVRTQAGGWSQYGAVPPKGARLRFTRYRYGGGRGGNVAPHTLTVLKSAIPGVASVTNPSHAIGGVDPESLGSARQRASMELRTRYRAVTAEDFEFLCGEASPRVARALCIASSNGAVRVHLVPRVEPADRLLALDELIPDDALFEEVAAYLDERRLIGTHVELRPAAYRGVSIVVNVQAALGADLARVEADVQHAIYTYLNPLTGGSLDGVADGWPFGRALNQGELFGVVHRVPGVDHVKILRVYETDLATGKQDPKAAGTHLDLAPDEVIASGQHIVKAEWPEP